jgi:hypothetical protein
LKVEQGWISSIADSCKEKKVKKHDDPDGPTAVTALLDHGAEVFTKKKFTHSQSKAQQRGNDIKNDRQEKMSAIRSRSAQEQLNRD